MFVISRRQIITPARFSPCLCAIYSKVENKRFNALGCLSARLSCLLQLLLLPHPQPLLPCKQLRSLRLHYIQTFASSDLSFHSAYILYSSFQVTAVYFLCSPAGRKGLRGVTLFANALTKSIPIKKQIMRHPLCRNLHRSQRTHSATLHSVLPLLPPYAPLAGARKTTVVRSQTTTFIAPSPHAGSRLSHYALSFCIPQLF